MGRWSQRKRRGGGGPSSGAAPLCLITSAVADGAGNVEVTFTCPVTDTDFDPAAFRDDTLADVAGSVIQGAATSLVYGFGSTPVAGDAWTYSDTVLGIATPQSGVMT